MAIGDIISNLLDKKEVFGPYYNENFVKIDEPSFLQALNPLKDNTDDPDLSFGQHFFISPVFGSDVAYIAEYISNISDTLCWCRLQLQMHKYIWDPDKRGV